MSLFTHQRYEYYHQFGNSFESDFESWFGKLAKRLYPNGDAQEVRLTQGDGKIDVYVISEQLVFQCYGPQSHKPSECSSKITRDFWGAMKHLDGNLKKWVFVHNHPTGRLDKDSLKSLNQIKTDLGEKGTQVEIASWGKEDLWQELESNLSHAELVQMFGEPELVDLDYDALAAVIKQLEQCDYGAEPQTIQEPDAEKLDFNDLGPAVKAFIKMARRVDHEVESYFGRCADPELGERIAERFRQRYKILKSKGHSPDDIFTNLRLDVGWKMDMKREFASMAIMSYFFHQCDIFENPTTVS